MEETPPKEKPNIWIIVGAILFVILVLAFVFAPNRPRIQTPTTHSHDGGPAHTH